jgi:hypothetical protein
MNPNESAGPAANVGVRLSTLWVFMMFNYLYCDVITLFDPTIASDLAPAALLAAAFLMEIPIAMVLLSRVLRHRRSRWANIVAGSFLTLVQVGTLFVGGGPAPYYLFFSAIEIGCLLFIIATAWRWASPGNQIVDARSAVAG